MRLIQKFQDHELGLTYTIVDLSSDNVVENCGFKSIDFTGKKAEFGIILHKAAWGKGLSQECHLLCLDYAFTVLALQMIYFTTDDHNYRMRGFFKKIGIRQQGKTADGQNYFELTKETWPLVRGKLAARPPEN